ncbi:hypothetical protein [Zhihengliuella sp. ISTPL4]|uniref:hypothetical protein n=1 Tax=Zhihengliuella sp. ISTPL4 TaxID=2058657 RepID=UPI0013052D6C|nr:hypothetical protein [Zhihengliuella sp. ISTPL4]
MIYATVGAALFALGAIVGRVGPKLGTTLAVLAVVAWFSVLGISVWGGSSTADLEELSAYLLIGLLAFLTGSSLTERRASARTRRSTGPVAPRKP